ncbi:MAG: hypothetical protein NTV82_11840 [Candidatus Aminicenantes bacterium]|nr:hypothetical protein [Candidatus Aminicenantes bacterium]
MDTDCPGNDPETALLPIRVFNAVPEPSFSAAKNSLPGIDFTDVGREAQTASPAGFFRAGCPRRRTREG